MEDIKNNGTINQEEEEKQNENANPDQNKAKEPGKIGAFFKKHAGKIKAGAAIAGAMCVGVAADRLGIKLGSKKKDDDRPAATEADV